MGSDGSAGSFGSGADASARDDAESATDASPDSARVDAGDGGDVCPHVIGPADCPSSNTECRATWSDVLANPICPKPGLSVNFSREERYDCSGYHVSLIAHVDTSQTYYYDATSGDLVAIYSSALILGPVCVAGPPSGITANCPNVQPVQICQQDAGQGPRG